MCWSGGALSLAIDEVTAPYPSRIRGEIRLDPSWLCTREFVLDVRGRHRWRPIAPCARIEVALAHPRLRWSGRAYLDSNAGGEPLEDAFERWQWARSARADGTTAIFYDVERRGAAPLGIALRFDAAGALEEVAPPPRVALPRTLWRIERATRCVPDESVSVSRTFEDTPFYARSLLEQRGSGHVAWTVHESLSLNRFRSRWVQALLPFRAPRRCSAPRIGPGKSVNFP